MLLLPLPLLDLEVLPVLADFPLLLFGVLADFPLLLFAVFGVFGDVLLFATGSGVGVGAGATSAACPAFFGVGAGVGVAVSTAVDAVNGSRVVVVVSADFASSPAARVRRVMKRMDFANIVGGEEFGVVGCWGGECVDVWVCCGWVCVGGRECVL